MVILTWVTFPSIVSHDDLRNKVGQAQMDPSIFDITWQLFPRFVEIELSNFGGVKWTRNQ